MGKLDHGTLLLLIRDGLVMPAYRFTWIASYSARKAADTDTPDMPEANADSCGPGEGADGAI